MPVLGGPGGRPGFAVAPWATIDDVCEPCDDYAFDTGLLERKLLNASEILYDLTGQAWPGVQEEIDVRPCGGDRGWFEVPGYPRLAGACGCNRGRACGCRRPSEVKMMGPVVSIDEVRVDGEVLSSDRYRVDDDRWLVFIPDSSGVDTRRGWPCCQDVTLPSTEEGTWAVDYTWGAAPPSAGVDAAAALGCELALACQRSSSCRLGRRVQSAARQGTSVVAADFADGKTGIAEVDLWVSSVLTGRRRRAAGVYVPGSGSKLRRTTIPPGS